MNDRLIKNLIYWGIILGVSIAVFCLVFFIPHNFSMIGWINGCFFSGGIILALGLLAMVGHFGAFDMFVYGVRDVFFHMNPSKDKVKPYKDYVEYIEKKKETRKKKGFGFFWPFLTFGLLLLVAAIVLRIVFAADTGVGI